MPIHLCKIQHTKCHSSQRIKIVNHKPMINGMNSKMLINWGKNAFLSSATVRFKHDYKIMNAFKCFFVFLSFVLIKLNQQIEVIDHQIGIFFAEKIEMMSYLEKNKYLESVWFSKKLLEIWMDVWISSAVDQCVCVCLCVVCVCVFSNELCYSVLKIN